MTLRTATISIGARVALAAMLATGAIGAMAGSVGAVVASPAVPMILQEVPTGDLQANTHGICHSGATLVIKNAQGTFNRAVYAAAAQACGLGVIWSFPDTVNYTTGVVYLNRIPALVKAVKNLPATWGYLTVKEPNWSKINGTEIRNLYHAFHIADPAHKVMALFGDIPHFGTSKNPYTKGMADVVMVDWYPVETSNGRNSVYLSGASKWFPKVRAFVAKTTPGTPIYLMVQTHKYLRPATHKKQLPTSAQLAREVREGFKYLHATGIAFHTWRNTNYTTDELRSPAMVSAMKTIISQVTAGTFH